MDFYSMDRFKEYLQAMGREELEEFAMNLVLEKSSEDQFALAEKLAAQSILSAANLEDIPKQERQKDLLSRRIQTMMDRFENHPEDFTICIDFNDCYDDWYDDTEDEYEIDDVNEILPVLQAAQDLVLEASSAGRMDEALQLYRAMMDTGLINEGDAQEYTDDSPWEILAGLSVLTSPNRILLLLLQTLLKKTSQTLAGKASQTASLAAQYPTERHLLGQLLQDAGFNSAEARIFCQNWIETLISQPDAGDCLLEDSIQTAFSYLPDQNMQIRVLLTAGSRVPQLFPWYLRKFTKEWDCGTVRRLLKNMIELTEDFEIKADLLAQAADIDMHNGLNGQAAAQLRQAFHLRPEIRTYLSLVRIDPSQDWLELLENTEIHDKWLKEKIAFFEGQTSQARTALSARMPRPNDRIFITLWLGLLSAEDLHHSALHALLERFMRNRRSENELTLLDYSFLFQRLQKRLHLSKADVRELTEQLKDWIEGYCRSVTKQQDREQYFRCAQFLRALEHVLNVNGDENSNMGKERVGDLLSRYPRFNSEYLRYR